MAALAALGFLLHNITGKITLGFKMDTVGTTTLLTELCDPESVQNFALLHTQNRPVEVFQHGCVMLTKLPC